MHSRRPKRDFWDHFMDWWLILTLSADSWGKQLTVDFFSWESVVACRLYVYRAYVEYDACCHDLARASSLYILYYAHPLHMMCVYPPLFSWFPRFSCVAAAFAVKGNKGGSFARLILKRRDSREPKRDIEPQHHTRIERRQHASSISSPKFPSNIPTTWSLQQSSASQPRFWASRLPPLPRRKRSAQRLRRCAVKWVERWWVFLLYRI